MSTRHRTVDDRSLVARAAQGDVEAFRKLVGVHSSLVYRVALRMLGKEDAQDASQEVWIRVFKSIKEFRAQSAFSTWLYRVTVNTCLSFRQREARLHEREYGGGGGSSGSGSEGGEEMMAYYYYYHYYLPQASAAEGDPEAEVLNAERREEIEAALGQVRAEHRAALVLRHMEGLSYAQIAEVLQVPDGTAKGWVSRGRAALLMALAQERTGEGEIS